jgi:hypothetical protein
LSEVKEAETSAREEIERLNELVKAEKEATSNRVDALHNELGQHKVSMDQYIKSVLHRFVSHFRLKKPKECRKSCGDLRKRKRSMRLNCKL